MISVSGLFPTFKHHQSLKFTRKNTIVCLISSWHDAFKTFHFKINAKFDKIIFNQKKSETRKKGGKMMIKK